MKNFFTHGKYSDADSPLTFSCAIVLAVTATKALKTTISSEESLNPINEAVISLNHAIEAIEQAQENGMKPILSDISDYIDDALESLSPFSELPGPLPIGASTALGLVHVLLTNFHDDAAVDNSSDFNVEDVRYMKTALDWILSHVDQDDDST